MKSSLHSFVDKIRPSEDGSGCWLWEGATGSDGYGLERLDRPQKVKRNAIDRYEVTDALDWLESLIKAIDTVLTA